ncbi:hypothetical protein LDDCCGHA_5706 [Methylobacterium oxalidis]|nr:hypothetical protein LDDCCGHA_5706 [Methylobacterium oxalidis]
MVSDTAALIIIIVLNVAVCGFVGYDLWKSEPINPLLWVAVGPLVLILVLQLGAWWRSTITREHPRERS